MPDFDIATIELADLPPELIDQREMWKALGCRPPYNTGPGAALNVRTALNFDIRPTIRPVPSGIRDLYLELASLIWGRQEGTVPLTVEICGKVKPAIQNDQYFRSALLKALDPGVNKQIDQVVCTDGKVNSQLIISPQRQKNELLGNQLAEAVAFTRFLKDVQATGISWDAFSGVYSPNNGEAGEKLQTRKMLEVFKDLSALPPGTKLSVDVASSHAARDMYQRISELTLPTPKGIRPLFETGTYDLDFYIRDEVREQMQVLDDNLPLLEKSRARFVGYYSDRSFSMIIAYNEMMANQLKLAWESEGDPDNGQTYDDFCDRKTLEFTSEELFKWVNRLQKEDGVTGAALIDINEVRDFIKIQLVYEQGKGAQTFRARDSEHVNSVVLTTYEKLIPVTRAQAKLFDNIDFNLPETEWPKTTQILYELTKSGTFFTRAQIAQIAQITPGLPKGKITLESFIQRYLRAADPELAHRNYMAADNIALGVISALHEAIKQYQLERVRLSSTEEGIREIADLFDYNFLPEDCELEPATRLPFSDARVSLFKVLLDNLVNLRSRVRTAQSGKQKAR